MRKLSALLLSALLIFSFAACGKTDNSSSAPQDTAVQGFVKPKDYTSVILVTINPQFRLYLDADGNVLAVEPVNKDAEDIQKNITFEHESYEKVIEDIITTANENGFIKENATVKFEVVEDKTGDPASLQNSTASTASSNTESTSSENTDAIKAKHTSEILNKARSAANTVAETLNIKIEVTVVGDTAETVSEPEHTHSFADATCTKPKTCACGATEGSALGHSYKNGICTRCSAKDPNYITPVAEKAGTWVSKKVNGTTLSTVNIVTHGTSGLSFEKAEAFDTLSDQIKNDPSTVQNTTTFNGVKYVAMLADGFDVPITENGNTVTIGSGFTIVLSRTDENTLKVTELKDMPSYLSMIAVGDVFNFNS